MGDIFDIIKDKANNHEDPVPQDAWDNIERRRKRRPIAAYWLTAAVLATIILTGGYYFIQQNKSPLTLPVSSVKENANGNKTATTTQQNQSALQSGNSASATESTTLSNQQTITTSANPTAQQPSVQAGINTTDAGDIQNGKKVLPQLDQSGKKSIANNASPDPNKEKAFNKKRKASKDRAAMRMQVSQADVAEETVSAKQNSTTVSVSPESVTNETEPQKSIAQNQTPQTTQEKEPGSVITEVKSVNPLSPETVSDKKQQDTKTKKNKKNPWILDLALTPVFSIVQFDQDLSFHRYLNLSDGKSEFNGKVTRVHTNPSLALSVGLRKVVSPKLTAGIGLQYMRVKEFVRITGLQTNTIFIVSDQHVNPGEGTVWSSDTSYAILERKGNVTATNRYSVLSIPVFMQFRLMQKKAWTMSLETGVNMNIFGQYSSNVNLQPSNTFVNNKQDVSRNTDIGFSVNTGFRIGKRLKNNTEVYALPFIGFSPVQQHIRQNLLDKKVHRSGISFGISRTL